MSDLGEAQTAPESAEVAALDDDRYTLIAKAYHLHCVQHQTVTYTAEALGVSRATAWRYAQQGKAQAKFLQQGPEDVRLALADGAGWLAGALAAEQQTIAGSWLDYAPAILKAFEFEAKIRLALTAEAGGRDGPPPDPKTVAALHALYETKGPSDGIVPQY